MDMDKFLCKECGSLLIQTSTPWAVCPNGHGRLLPAGRGFAPQLRKAVRIKSFSDDTPTATHEGKGWYKLSGRTEDFRRVKTKNSVKMVAEKCPKGCVVAIFEDRPEVFRVSGRPRKRSSPSTPPTK
jgi:hypothetical protein